MKKFLSIVLLLGFTNNLKSEMVDINLPDLIMTAKKEGLQAALKKYEKPLSELLEMVRDEVEDFLEKPKVKAEIEKIKACANPHLESIKNHNIAQLKAIGEKCLLPGVKQVYEAAHNEYADDIKGAIVKLANKEMKIEKKVAAELPNKDK